MKRLAPLALVILAACADGGITLGEVQKRQAEAKTEAAAAEAEVDASAESEAEIGEISPSGAEVGEAAPSLAELSEAGATDGASEEAGKPAAPVDAKAIDAPHIYMALQPDTVGPLSVIFAIDAARDGTPEDDPAIRITPLEGKCNPQDLRRYDFPAAARARPTFGPEEAAKGVTAKELPTYLATAVSAEMIRLGHAADLKGSQPQNVCTRKLWEQMVVNESLRAG